MKEKLAHAVVRDKDIGKSVVIVIGKRDAKRAALKRPYAGAKAYVFKGAVTTIAIEDIRRRRELGWRAIRLPLTAADLAVLGIPLHIPRDKQIEMTVVIVVEEPG